MRYWVLVLAMIGCADPMGGATPSDSDTGALLDARAGASDGAADSADGVDDGGDGAMPADTPDPPDDASVTPDGSDDIATDLDQDGAADTAVDVGPDVVDDAGLEAGPPADLAEPGCFFTPQGGQDTRRYDFGERGLEYDRLEISFTVTLASWREELFDREVLTHIFFGLFRNAPVSRRRYILGAAAQIRPARIPGTRQAVFFARVDLEPRPNREGYTAYTSFRRNHPWEPATAYRVHAVLDAARRTQHLTLTAEGGEPFQIDGDIAYFDRSLTSDGWWLQLGAEDTDHRDVNVVDWTFCDLEIRLQ